MTLSRILVRCCCQRRQLRRLRDLPEDIESVGSMPARPAGPGIAAASMPAYVDSMTGRVLLVKGASIFYLPDRCMITFSMIVIIDLYDGRAAPRRVNGKTGGAKSPQGRGSRRRAEQGIGVRGIEHRVGRVGEGGA